MAGKDDQRPIIIKRVKKVSGGHHGGAWKVAYADFVTAMMAFFLLLWLISSVNKAKLEGLAEYFTPTVGIKDSMGIGFEGGETPDSEGKEKDSSQISIIQGQTPQGPVQDTPDKKADVENTQDAHLFEKAEESIKQAFESDPNLRDLKDNIIVEQSPEGLKIQVMDSDKNPMFDPGSTLLSAYGQRVMAKMQAIIEKMPNYISITGHTDTAPFGKTGDYTNWELSADRANASRRYLLRSGMNPERVQKVVGMADKELLFKDQPKSPKNRRITIILLRGAYLDLQNQQLPASRDLLSVPSTKNLQEIKDKQEKEMKQKKEDEMRRLEKENMKNQQNTDPLGAFAPSVTGTGGPTLTIKQNGTETVVPVGEQATPAGSNPGDALNPTEKPSSAAPGKEEKVLKAPKDVREFTQ